MRTRRYLVVATVLIALLSALGCSKKPAQNAAAQNLNNPTAAAQPNNNAAPQEASAANRTAAPSGTAVATNAAPAPNNATPGAANNATAAAPQPTPQPLVIPAGTPITVRLQERLSSASSVPGERFEAVIDQPIVVGEQIVVPMGALASGHVVIAHRSGRLHHPGELGVTLDSVTIGQQQIPLATSNFVARGASHKKRNWSWIGGGSSGGAVIGALAAGGKGALIGGGIGAAAGTTTALITGKKDVVFGSERRLRFRLNQSVSVSG
jgi:hypothetical protein